MLDREFSAAWKRGLAGLLLMFALSSCIAPANDHLALDEQLMLQQRMGKLEVLFGYEAPPNAYHDENGQYVGLLVDFLQEIEGHAGISFVRRNFDTWDELIEYSKTGRNFIIVGIAHTEPRAEYLSFTGSFVKVPYVIVTRKESGLARMSDLVGSVVCTVTNYAVNDYIAGNYSKISPMGVADNLAGLRMVSTSECDAMVVNQMYASYLIASQGLTNLKIAGESGYFNRLSAASSIKDQKLFNILDNAVDRIETERRQELYRKWVSTGSAGLSRSVVITLGVAAGITVGLVALFWLWSLSLRKQVRKQTRQIQAAKEQFEQVIRRVPIPMVITDSNQDILLFNNKFIELFGYTLEDISTAEDWWVAAYPDEGYRHRVQEAWKQAVAQAVETDGEIEIQEWDLAIKDGSVRRVEFKMTPFEDISVIAMNDITEHRQAETALLESERKYREIVNNIPDLLYRTDLEGRIVFVSPSVKRLSGYAPDEVVGMWAKDVYVDPDGRKLLLAELQRNGFVENFEVKLRRKDGSIRWASASVHWVMDQDGNVQGEEGIVRDITQRKQAEEQIRTLSQAIEQSSVSVLIADIDGKIEYVNSAFERITGYSAAEILGQHSRVLKSGRTPKSLYSELWNTISSGKSWRGEFQNRKKSGEVFWEYAHIAPVLDERGAIRHYLAVTEDITLRKQQEEHILHQAHFDGLTDLPNRFLALDRLSQMLNEAQRNRELVAVLFLDLDDFKKINDTLGHDMGDKLLIEAASRLRDTVRSGDTVGRLGGDEFIVLIGGLEDAADVSPVVENLLNRFRDAFSINDRELILTASIGIAVYPDDGNSPSELLRKADSAMYHSKEQGSNTYSYFTDAMNRAVSRRLALEEQMHGALDRGEFRLCYQSMVDVGSVGCIGVEALLRWHNPALGEVCPQEFIPIAEQTGLIVPIGQFVLSEALGMAARWQKYHEKRFRISINLSPRQFRDPDLVPFIEKVLRQSGVSGESLELEITEGVLMSGHAYIDDALTKLNDMGVGIAMDDFGTGYSSLSYLRTYPFNVLKIDRSFVNDITVDAADRELVNAAIAMAHALGLKVVAEGVETKEQLELLAAQGCEFAQGFLFSEPVSPEKISEIFARQCGPKESIDSPTSLLEGAD